MPTLPRRRWLDMTTAEFAALPADTVAVLPVAAVEQHGPHLPVYVDACLNEGVVARAIELLPPELPVSFLPMQAVGKSNEHLAFPGTLSLSAETLIRLWTEIGESVHRAGVRKLVLFNSHGGNDFLKPFVREMTGRSKVFLSVIDWWRVGKDVYGEIFAKNAASSGIDTLPYSPTHDEPAAICS